VDSASIVSTMKSSASWRRSSSVFGGGSTDVPVGDSLGAADFAGFLRAARFFYCSCSRTRSS
jgi:hypothetical protein